MKALKLFFAIVVLAVSACQSSSPLAVEDEDRSLQQSGDSCWPDASPC
jgi:hypothetical protein